MFLKIWQQLRNFYEWHVWFLLGREKYRYRSNTIKICIAFCNGILCCTADTNFQVSYLRSLYFNLKRRHQRHQLAKRWSNIYKHLHFFFPLWKSKQCSSRRISKLCNFGIFKSRSVFSVFWIVKISLWYYANETLTTGNDIFFITYITSVLYSYFS